VKQKNEKVIKDGIRHKIIQRMYSTTPFAFLKGNRLIKIRMNIIKSEETVEISPNYVSRTRGDIGTVV